MSEIKIEIKNLDQIKQAFIRSPTEMTKQLNTAIKKTVFYIRGESVKEAPVRTGFLRGSAYTTFSNLKGETGFRANYAGFVHNGTRFTKSNPFLRRAVEKSDVTINRFFYEAVQNTLDKIEKDTK